MGLLPLMGRFFAVIDCRSVQLHPEAFPESVTLNNPFGNGKLT